MAEKQMNATLTALRWLRGRWTERRVYHVIYVIGFKFNTSTCFSVSSEALMRLRSKS